MSRQNRSTGAELVKLISNLIYASLIFTIILVLSPIILGIGIYKRRKNEN